LIATLRLLLAALACGFTVPALAALTDHADGTVTDTVTGLMWDKCSWGQTYTVATNSCSAVGDATGHTWAAALGLAVTANALNLGVGHRSRTDWRIPNAQELESLVKIDTHNPAIDATVFPNTRLSNYWTSTTYSATPAHALQMHFGAGSTNAIHKASAYYVRLVRSGQAFASFDSLPDSTPDAFAFTAQTGVALNAVVTSNTITVAGINLPSAISIAGGSYSINGGAYTAAAGSVNNGNTVSVRQTASGSDSTTTTATLTIGGVNGAFSATTVAADTTPDAFSFTAQTGVALNAVGTSNTITVAGINAASAVSIAGGSYSINGGAYTAAAGSVNNGDTVTVRQTASGSNSTTTTATLTIGGVSGAFNATTVAVVADTTPDAFSFTAQTGVALNAVVTSSTITVAGINAASAVSIAGGSYSINGGAYTAAAGTVNNGNTVTVRQTASASNSTTTTATLTIGGVNGAFNATTVAAVVIPPVVVIPQLTMPSSCGLRAWPAVVNMGEGEGPAFAADLVPLLAKALDQPLAVPVQGACGSVTLNGYNTGKLAFVPHSYLASGDTRANGIYALGDGRYQVVRNGQSLTIAPATVRLDQLAALLPGLSATLGDNGVLVASLDGGVIYVVLPSAAAQSDVVTGNARLVMGADGYWHFMDAQGNNQILYPAFADTTALRNALQSLDAAATMDVQLDGTASVVFNSQRYTLVPDLTLAKVPGERVGQYWWQENATRFWVVNAQPLGTVQGFTVKP
jgi:hypothetical protein